MSSGKSGGGSKDYFGHVAGIVCQGQLDFVWGMMIENELVWPKARLWDSRVHKKGKTVIYTDGNVYRASAKTDIDPPTFPWVLLATPWAAGEYDEDERVLKGGHVWIAVETTSGEPPDAIPTEWVFFIQIQAPEKVVNGWLYESTPEEWADISGENFWDANAIVAWKGKLYTTPTGTNAEPPSAPWVLWKVNRADSPNPLKFTVEDRGDVFLYWGTSTQTLDAGDEAILTALGHPPYRHRALLVLKDFRFGTMQITAPDVALLGGRKPVQTLITGDAAELDDDWQANPWCVLAELLTHPVYGLGLPASWFNEETFQAQADWCLERSDITYISPMITSLQSVRDLVNSLLGYAHGFVFWSSLATLAAGHWPYAEAAPAFTAATTIDRHDLVEEISWNSDGWGGTASSVSVRIDDIQAGFKGRPITANNMFNLQVTRRAQNETADRSFVVRSGQAAAIAKEAAKIAGEQLVKGTLTVRAEKAASITPGSLFLLTDDELQISEVMRCTKKSITPGRGTAKLTFETERGVSPQAYAPSGVNPEPEQGPAPAAITNAVFIPLPAVLGTGPNQIACLAERRNEHTSGFDVWFQQADAAAYQLLGGQGSFAVPGVLMSETDENIYNGLGIGNWATQVIGPVTQGETYALDEKEFWNFFVYRGNDSDVIPISTPSPIAGVDYLIDSDAGTITVLAGGNIATGQYIRVNMCYALALQFSDSVGASDLESVMGTITEDEVLDGKLLLVAVKADLSDFELMSVRAVAVMGPNLANGGTDYRVTVRRGALGSTSRSFDANDLVFLVFREDIVPLSHSAFPGLIGSGATANFRLAPFSAWVAGDPDDLYDPANNPDGLATQFAVPLSNVYAPTATWVRLLANGADISDFSVAFSTTTAFSFAFQLFARESNLAHASLVAALGSQEVTLWSQTFGQSQTEDRVVNFTLGTGLWTIRLHTQDINGNASVIPLTQVGETEEVELRMEPPATGTAPTPVIYGYTVLKSGLAKYIYNLDFGWLPAGITVKWQLQNKGTAYNPASWTVAAAHLDARSDGYRRYGYVTPSFRSGSYTLYAYCEEAGKANSAVVSWNL